MYLLMELLVILSTMFLAESKTYFFITHRKYDCSFQSEGYVF